jgi:chromosome segregation ATPase
VQITEELVLSLLDRIESLETRLRHVEASRAKLIRQCRRLRQDNALLKEKVRDLTARLNRPHRSIECGLLELLHASVLGQAVERAEGPESVRASLWSAAGARRQDALALRGQRHRSRSPGAPK